MKVIVNYPKGNEEIKEFQKRVAQFNATLVIETIKRLEIDEISKKQVLDGVLDKLKKDLSVEQV